VKPVKVLFLLPYPLHNAPSQRFRIEAFFPVLKKSHIEVTTQVFLNEKSWEVLYKNGAYIQKLLAVLNGFLKRWWACLFLVRKFDYVVVHREAAPIGPPVFEWIIANLWKKKMIYDFDDAIWIPAISDQNQMAVFVKCFWKIKWLCKWSYKVSAGNQFLANFAEKYNKSVSIIPTVVDTKHRYTSLVDQRNTRPSIGWTGSHSTMKYLDQVIPVLQKLEEKWDFDFYVISNKEPGYQLRSLKFIQWNELKEIDDLSKINIGIMPLESDQWSEGKCGFKIIQYLALGIPAVASPVGVNNKIIGETNGFLCHTYEEWYAALSVLLADHDLREQMGRAGREKIISTYSIQATEALFLDLFK
jgi:glycosyltransferase involved in cell wall biosynthesis